MRPIADCESDSLIIKIVFMMIVWRLGLYLFFYNSGETFLFNKVITDCAKQLPLKISISYKIAVYLNDF